MLLDTRVAVYVVLRVHKTVVYWIFWCDSKTLLPLIRFYLGDVARIGKGALAPRGIQRDGLKWWRANGLPILKACNDDPLPTLKR